MKEIALSQNQVALIDDEDFEIINQYKWYARWNENTQSFYASNNTTAQMHRFILGVTDPNIHVDHEDHDTLNNCRKNLRPSTRSQNRANSRKQSGTPSKYRGVYRYKEKANWRATIRHNGKAHHLGSFKDEKEAAIAFNKAAVELHGEFASLNLID